jgi:hypothetical protein
MGGYFSSEFTIYGRLLEDDNYQLIEEVKEGNPMSRFKHETFAFALKRKHQKMKSLYLYCGYNRIAKCGRETAQQVPYIIVDFSTAEAAMEWDKCQEQIPKVYLDLQWLENSFSKEYVEITGNDVFKRRYQNYKLSMKN